MHSIVRRMRCEVNSAAALLASVDLPLRLWALVLIDLVDDVLKGGRRMGNCHAVGSWHWLVNEEEPIIGCIPSTIDHHPIPPLD